jgi:hypothetical protein
MTLTVSKIEGRITLANGDASIDMTVGEPGDTPTLIDLFGASNDSTPSQNTQSLRHEAVRPFTEDGNTHLYRGTVAASQMHDDNSVRLQLNRVNS